jgi:hypothetical protein
LLRIPTQYTVLTFFPVLRSRIMLMRLRLLVKIFYAAPSLVRILLHKLFKSVLKSRSCILSVQPEPHPFSAAGAVKRCGSGAKPGVQNRKIKKTPVLRSHIILMRLRLRVKTLMQEVNIRVRTFSLMVFYMIAIVANMKRKRM